MLKIAVLLLLVLGSVTSHARFGSNVTPTSTGFNIKFSKDGTPMAVPLAQEATGVAVRTTVPLAINQAVTLPVAAAAVITGGMMGGPWGAAIGGLGVVGVVAIPAFADAFNRAGLRAGPSGQLQKTDPNVCTVAPCAEYRVTSPSQPSAAFYATPAAACTAYVAWGASQTPASNWVNNGATVTQCFYKIIRKSDGVVTTDGAVALINQGVAPKPAAYVDILLAEGVSALTARAPTVAEVQAMIDQNFPPEVLQPVLTGPAFVSDFNTVELGLDGTVLEIEKRYNASFSPGVVNITTTTTQKRTTPAVTTNTTTTNPDGTTTTSVTVKPPATTTITTTDDGKPVPATCGLPGAPVCAVKIDETGTAEAPKLDGQKTADDITKPIKDFALNPASKLPALPTLNWSFQLPTGCTAIAIPAFAPYLQGIDICPFLPMFHDLMTVVWVMGGLFGAIGTFWRNVFSQN